MQTREGGNVHGDRPKLCVDNTAQKGKNKKQHQIIIIIINNNNNKNNNNINKAEKTYNKKKPNSQAPEHKRVNTPTAINPPKRAETARRKTSHKKKINQARTEYPVKP